MDKVRFHKEYVSTEDDLVSSGNQLTTEKLREIVQQLEKVSLKPEVFIAYARDSDLYLDKEERSI